MRFCSEASQTERIEGQCRLALACLLLMIGGTTGCQSGAIRAANLPPEFRTSSVANGSKINMARLSSSGLGNSQLAPGDLLEVTIASGLNDKKLVPELTRVSSDGNVELSSIGLVPVAGLEPYDASRNIAAASVERGIYLKPHVTLDIKSKAVNHITVMGEVEEPGIHEIPRNASNLLNALGIAGGMTEDASMSIEIVRHAPTLLATDSQDQPNSNSLAKPGATSEAEAEVQLASYSNLSALASPSATNALPANRSPNSLRIDLAAAHPRATDDYHLQDGDMVMVHRRDPRLIHVAGLVQKPGQFDLPSDQDVHLLDAVALAGGLSSPVADKVFIIRHLENNPQPLVIQASLNAAKHHGDENIRLAAGDTISIERTPTTVAVDTFSKIFRVAFGVSTGVTAF